MHNTSRISLSVNTVASIFYMKVLSKSIGLQDDCVLMQIHMHIRVICDGKYMKHIKDSSALM